MTETGVVVQFEIKARIPPISTAANMIAAQKDWVTMYAQKTAVRWTSRERSDPRTDATKAQAEAVITMHQKTW